MGAQFDKQSSSRQGTTQAIAYSTATAITNAFGPQTYQIRLSSTSACQYLISEAASVVPATATNGSFLPANWVEFVTVTPGQKISVIQAPTNGLVTGTAGTLLVTEVS